jgi:methylmalonyl-CoA mutase, N-terminal domain
LGGTQSLHTNSRDEAICLPTEDSVRIALRTQQVIGYESGVADTIDPLAGSYCVEALTNDIEKRALAYLHRIDAMGGALAAIEAGFVQREIMDSAYTYQRAIETKQQIIVGVNEFVTEDFECLGTLRVDPEVGQQQVARLAALKKRRDSQRVAGLLGSLREAAGGKANLMPILLDCAEAYITLGEICDVLRQVFGEYQPVSVL